MIDFDDRLVAIVILAFAMMIMLPNAKPSDPAYQEPWEFPSLDIWDPTPWSWAVEIGNVSE